FSSHSFPLMAEPNGNRMVIEAAGSYNDDPARARAVVFGHDQFGRSPDDDRQKLFENAVQWVSRKSNPSEIVVGIGPQLETNYFVARGYQVRLLPEEFTETNLLAG